MKEIAIIGLGLIGGSIAAAVKNKKSGDRIVGYDIDSHVMEKAYQQKLIDAYDSDMKSVMQSADVILIATPVGQFSMILSEIAKHLKDNQIVTDVCSVKLDIIEKAKTILKERIKQFVPGHPLAGSEKSGLDAVESDLFLNRTIILTPIPTVTDEVALSEISSFWESLQATVAVMSSSEHDRILSMTSHLPHAIIFSYVDMFRHIKDAETVLKYTARSFEDMTRISHSDPNMWKEIFLSNRNDLLKTIDAFKRRLDTLQDAISNNDMKKIMEIISG